MAICYHVHIQWAGSLGIWAICLEFGMEGSVFACVLAQGAEQWEVGRMGTVIPTSPPHPRQGKFSKVAQLRAGSIPSPEEPSPTSPERPPPVCFRSEGALCILLGVSDALCREGLLTGTCWRFVIAVYTVTGCIREACTSWEMVAGIPSRS